MLDVVVEKSFECDELAQDEQERDHSQVLAKQMMSINQGHISSKANAMYHHGTSRYCKAVNTCMSLR